MQNVQRDKYVSNNTYTLVHIHTFGHNQSHTGVLAETIIFKIKLVIIKKYAFMCLEVLTNHVGMNHKTHTRAYTNAHIKAYNYPIN